MHGTWYKKAKQNNVDMVSKVTYRIKVLVIVKLDTFYSLK